MIIRLSQKLKDRVKVDALASKPAVENPYGDWSARTFIVERIHYVLLTNTRSLYSTVFYARGITDANQLITRSMNALREFMEADGLLMMYETLVAPESATIQFAKVLNRSVTGAMNDLVYMATVDLIGSDFSPFDVGFRLNETPYSFLKEIIPRKAFKAMGGRLGEKELN